MSPVVATTYDPLATQSRSSSSNNSGPPTPVVPSHSPLSQHFFTPPSSNFNLDPPKIAMISSNKVPSTSIELLDPKTSSSVPPSISLQDIYSSPVNQVRSPGIQSFNTNATNTGTSISAPVVSQPVNVALGLPVSIPLHQVQSLKRGTPTQSEGHHDEQLQKRPRLEGSQLELTTNIPIEFVADGTEDTIQMDVEEDDEVIEVGPDGLRLVEDCIFDLFGEEGGEGRNCKLCIARRDMGYHVEPLKPFVNATNDELLEHCVTEHAEAWDTLRHSV
ncbi:hypothetical protein BYT27DRAFT_6413485 [Phlegmacium glaucopus]|nr:hypothetical protein BYT27DRAFT_6413485 [Phlegmacium glaucopus]